MKLDLSEVPFVSSRLREACELNSELYLSENARRLFRRYLTEVLVDYKEVDISHLIYLRDWVNEGKLPTPQELVKLDANLQNQFILFIFGVFDDIQKDIRNMKVLPYSYLFYDSDKNIPTKDNDENGHPEGENE